MRDPWSIEQNGRRISVAPESAGWSDPVVLRIDGEQVAQAKPQASRATVAVDGVRVEVRVAWHGMSIVRAELVGADGARTPLDPPAGTLAARREELARSRPGLYALHHVAVAVGKVLLPLLGVGLLLGLLPDISIDVPLPDLPDLPLPDVPWPSIDLPELPGWLRAIAESAQYWGPVVVGIGLAIAEYRRGRRAVTSSSRRS